MATPFDSDALRRVLTEDSPLNPFQVCRALTDFQAQQQGDLSFHMGEHLIIVEPSEALFWYKARNVHGHEGLVPRTFLERVNEKEEEYLSMRSATNEKEVQNYDPVEKEMLRIQEKEMKRRLPSGTLVIGTCQFVGEKNEDLPFSVYQEMSLLHPSQDLCWYYAQKTDYPHQKGMIPITHVRLVYMSDDDEDDEMLYDSSTIPAHDRLYDDINDFVSQSGWFSHPGLAHGKSALQHVIARKAGVPYDVFATLQKAIYVFDYGSGEKVYVGSASILKNDICRHFESFGKKREDITSFDDELCHHTESSMWEITIWPLQQNYVLEFEVAKKIIELNALKSKEMQKGLNEQLSFTSMKGFDRLWEWFCP